MKKKQEMKPGRIVCAVRTVSDIDLRKAWLFYLLHFQGTLEKPEEGAQTKAIHVIQLGQVTDHKEQRTATLSQGKIRITLLSREQSTSIT